MLSLKEASTRAYRRAGLLGPTGWTIDVYGVYEGEAILCDQPQIDSRCQALRRYLVGELAVAADTLVLTSLPAGQANGIWRYGGE
jgi:hypothetical protein